MKKTSRLVSKYTKETRFMTNIDTTDNIHINGAEIEKAANYKYLGQAIAMENRTK